jgi:hypothetical protein
MDQTVRPEPAIKFLPCAPTTQSCCLMVMARGELAEREARGNPGAQLVVYTAATVQGPC